MARRDRTARPRATDEPSEAEPAAAAASTSTSTRSSRKRSHADALATDAVSGAETPTEVSEDGTKLSKRGKKAKDDVEKVAATAKDGQTPHLAQGASDATTTAAAASNSGPATSNDRHEDAAGPEERIEAAEEAPTKVDETKEMSPLEGMTAEERRAIKGKGRATIIDAQAGADAESERVAGLQKDLAGRDELVASQTAILASLCSSVTCTVCLERLERPFALQCGHVFCRKCLINWFFRAKPEGPGDGAVRSGTDSNASSDSSDSDRDATSASSSSRRRALAEAATAAGARGPRAPSESAEDRDRRRRVEADLWGDQPGPSIAAATTGPSASAEQPSAAGEDENLNADAMRRARLARFDSRRNDGAADAAEAVASTSGAGSAAGPPNSTAAQAASASTAPQGVSGATASTSAISAPAAIPPPASFPTPVPTGEHRAQNLVCPQCRASCSLRAPHRIFALDEILAVLARARVSEEGTRPRSASPVKLHGGKGKGKLEEVDPAVISDSDLTWGGLFPGVGGTESAKDRRRRLAQVVRDREDGVRRCGHCNWELDERTGICEGCGRQWDVSSDDDEDSQDSTGAVLAPFGRRRNLARQHHALFASGSADTGSENGSGSDRGEALGYSDGSVGGSGSDSYESDFVEKSDEEVEPPGRHAHRASARAARRAEPAVLSSDSDDDADSSDSGDAQARRIQRLRGEVIDPDSDSGSESSSSDGSGSDGSGSGSGSGSTSSSDGDDDGRTRRTRSGRAIVPGPNASTAVAAGFETSSGDEDYASGDSEGDTEDDSESASSSAGKGSGRPQREPASRKKKRVIALSSDDE
ncbi:hypothetical protein JCM8202v2_003424 [Rhodotorula sphaerocarpa]